MNRRVTMMQPIICMLSFIVASCSPAIVTEPVAKQQEAIHGVRIQASESPIYAPVGEPIVLSAELLPGTPTGGTFSWGAYGPFFADPNGNEAVLQLADSGIYKVSVTYKIEEAVFRDEIELSSYAPGTVGLWFRRSPVAYMWEFGEYDCKHNLDRPGISLQDVEWAIISQTGSTIDHEGVVTFGEPGRDVVTVEARYSYGPEPEDVFVAVFDLIVIDLAIPSGLIKFDVNGDGIVDDDDIVEAQKYLGLDRDHWSWNRNSLAADVNGDGVVDAEDIALIESMRGTTHSINIKNIDLDVVCESEGYILDGTFLPALRPEFPDIYHYATDFENLDCALELKEGTYLRITTNIESASLPANIHFRWVQLDESGNEVSEYEARFPWEIEAGIEHSDIRHNEFDSTVIFVQHLDALKLGMDVVLTLQAYRVDSPLGEYEVLLEHGPSIGVRFPQPALTLKVSETTQTIHDPKKERFFVGYEEDVHIEFLQPESFLPPDQEWYWEWKLVSAHELHPAVVADNGVFWFDNHMPPQDDPCIYVFSYSLRGPYKEEPYVTHHVNVQLTNVSGWSFGIPRRTLVRFNNKITPGRLMVSIPERALSNGPVALAFIYGANMTLVLADEPGEESLLVLVDEQGGEEILDMWSRENHLLSGQAVFLDKTSYTLLILPDKFDEAWAGTISGFLGGVEYRAGPRLGEVDLMVIEMGPVKPELKDVPPANR